VSAPSLPPRACDRALLACFPYIFPSPVELRS
jgi:hypothetical protein